MDTGHTGKITSFAFRRDERLFATASDDYKIKLWDSSTLSGLDRQPEKPLLTLFLPQVVLSIAFSPDGSKLAAGVGDGTARLWDVTTGIELMSFHGHASDVQSVAFSPDGQWLATSGTDGIAFVWDITG